ncbi:putative BAH domain-containing protein [Rosa chinensis]|uniref:Putative BAH domain-containing protein n=1 Tax=Rosa chinensis TaxID=74649 RepID=A0A2P6QUC5_ROSCH|nr:putative BAH domain-containing protein [Rosa chinensis]
MRSFSQPLTLKTVKVGYCVQLKKERGKISYVARIHQIYIKHGDISQNVHQKVQWFYKHLDTKMKHLSFIAKNEPYMSNHFDNVLTHSILSTCTIRSFNSSTKIKDVDANVFFTRFTYNHMVQEFKLVEVDVFYYCQMPYNLNQVMV